jgi:hypothetical protein
MRSFALIILIMTLHVPTAKSAEAAARGLGTLTCAKFAQVYRDDPDRADLLFGSWAQGFMSGRNVTLMRDKNVYRDLASETADEENLGIRQYCDAHPLVTFLQAVEIHFLTLPIKSVPQSN